MDSTDRVRTVFIGTGAFAIPSLRALWASPDSNLLGVVTAPARPAGRRGDLRVSPVSDVTRELGIDVVQSPARLRRPEAVAAVLALRPDLIVLADYGQIVPRPLLDVPLGALNLHPSLLPRHRGAAPIPATIIGGDARTGVSLMRMDDGLDTGPLVAVEEITLTGSETSPILEADLAERGAVLLLRILPAWRRGEVRARPQTHDGATLTRPLRRDDGRLDPSLPAHVLERRVRAFQPWPGSWFEVSGGRFTVWDAAVRPGRSAFAAGEIRAEDARLLLETVDGALELVEVQPAGGRRMSGGELVRGRPGLLVKRVESPAEGLQPGPIERPVGYSGVP